MSVCVSALGGEGVDSRVNPRDSASAYRRVCTGMCARGECEGCEWMCVWGVVQARRCDREWVSV